MSTLDLLELRQLGRTHMRVTALSLGGAGLGGVFGPVSDADGVASVEKALELGINYFDTSPQYGDAERRMGIALRGVPRDRYYISSKVGTHPNRPRDYSADAARWTVDNSLRVLGVEYLDLCHIHEPQPFELDRALAPNGALGALLDLRAQGVIRAIGIGVEDHELHRRLIETGEIDVSMLVNDFTLIRQHVQDVVDLARARGIGLVNGAPLAMGLLSGREPHTIGTPIWNPPVAEVVAARKVHAWCAVQGISVLALALQFSLRATPFDCTLIGASTAEEVSGCWDAASAEIPDSVWTDLPDLLDEVRVA